MVYAQVKQTSEDLSHQIDPQKLKSLSTGKLEELRQDITMKIRVRFLYE